MDQRTSAIDQDLKDIAQTRIAIAEKWDALEQQITHRVEDVTMTCSDMLNRATDNIGAFVNKTKAVVDPVHRIDRHPWLMLGGALCAGYAIGLIEQGNRHQRRGVCAAPGSCRLRLNETPSPGSRKACMTTILTNRNPRSEEPEAMAQTFGVLCRANSALIQKKPSTWCYRSGAHCCLNWLARPCLKSLARWV